MDFSGGSDGKESVYSAGDLGSIPGLGRFFREGYGNPLQGVGWRILPGESHVQRSLEGYSPWGRTELDTTEWLSTAIWYTLKVNRWTIMTKRLNPALISQIPSKTSCISHTQNSLESVLQMLTNKPNWGHSCWVESHFLGKPSFLRSIMAYYMLLLCYIPG